jgi:DnaB helicase-like protein
MVSASTGIYERARNRVDTLERFRLAEAIVDQRGWTAGELVATFAESDFQSPLHRAVYKAIRALIGRGGRDLDVGLVVAEMQSQGTFEQFANAMSYVCSLTEGSVPVSSRESRAFRLQEMKRGWEALRAAKAADHGD